MWPARIMAALGLSAGVIAFPGATNSPAVAHPAQRSVRILVEPAESELDYEVHARLFLVADEDIVGRNREVSGEAEVSGSTVTGQIRLRAAGFKSGVGTRDRHVAQILEAGLFPEITFALSKVGDFDPGTPTGRCTVEGTLTVRDRNVPLAIPVHYVRSGYRLRLDGAAHTRFSEFGIAPPILGFIVKRSPDDLYLRAHLAMLIQNAL